MRTSTYLTAAAALVFLSATGSAGAATGAKPVRGVAKAQAVLQPKSGSRVSGTVSFEQRGGGVLVRVEAKGVPEGPHGFHIHEKGDCSAPDAASAGGHFNPAKQPHAGPGAKRHHAGDMGNAMADAQGNVKHESLYTGFSLAGGKAAVLGKAVILHAQPDDLKSQPTGEAGGRIACGIIDPAPGQPRTRR